MTDPVPALLVLGPTAGALIALAVLYADRTGPATAPIRPTPPTVTVLDPLPLPGWATWKLREDPASQSLTANTTLRWRRTPLASVWPDPPPSRHFHQSTALTTSVARAWDMQGCDW